MSPEQRKRLEAAHVKLVDYCLYSASRLAQVRKFGNEKREKGETWHECLLRLIVNGAEPASLEL